MPILLKILGESHQGMSHRDMGGISGINYRFDWEPKHGAFTYEAQTQEQIDDIIQVNFLPNFPWRFSFIMPDGEPRPAAADGEEKPPVYEPVAKIAPWVAPGKYASYPPVDLVELAKNCGFSPQGSLEDPVNLREQLDAYMVGRAFALEENKRLRKENDEMHRLLEKAPPAPSAPAPVALAPEPPAPAPSPEPAAEPSAPVPRQILVNTGKKKAAGKKPRQLQLA